MSIINIEHSIVSKVNFPKFSLTVTKLAKVPEFSLDKVPEGAWIFSRRFASS